MIAHSDYTDVAIRAFIRKGEIVLAGNRPQKIFGLLECRSGKKMKKSNRVFFGSYTEAVMAGFRPCGHCLKKDYDAWAR